MESAGTFAVSTASSAKLLHFDLPLIGPVTLRIGVTQDMGTIYFLTPEGEPQEIPPGIHAKYSLKGHAVLLSPHKEWRNNGDGSSRDYYRFDERDTIYIYHDSEMLLEMKSTYPQPVKFEYLGVRRYVDQLDSQYPHHVMVNTAMINVGPILENPVVESFKNLTL